MTQVFFFSPIFALAKLFPETGRKDATLREILLVLVCLGTLSFGLLLWAAFIRKRKRHSSGHSHHISKTAAVGEKGSEPRKRRHRHRRRRSSNYPQNPTLAQTGGLPPVRRDEPPASPQQTGTQPP
jgi:hypothetical protein